MTRIKMIETIGTNYQIENTEKGEYSYVKVCRGGRKELERLLERKPKHETLDIRFVKGDFVILVETKKKFTAEDEFQLGEYVELEKALHHTKKIIAILANTTNDDIKVFKSFVDDDHYLVNETTLKSFEYYDELFSINKTNDREQVLSNTYKLNETLHSIDIDEKTRSQLVGTALLYIKNFLLQQAITEITESSKSVIVSTWSAMTPNQIIAGIKDTLENLLDGSDNKAKKVELLQKNILQDQKVKKLTKEQWLEILTDITFEIYKFIDTNSIEGQDILNLFFIAFNKYTGKADKNQAFTPDHITEFMCRVCNIDSSKKVLDPTCGSGSFLVQAMVKELADCKSGKTIQEAQPLMKDVKLNNIFGIEVEEKAFGLATTNMLIHGDGNSNIKFGSCFNYKDFIKKSDPDIILMNPPYNAKTINIPNEYKANWSKKATVDPTKGLVFVEYISDIIKELNNERLSKNKQSKYVKMAVLLPMQCAIANSNIIKDVKKKLLLTNTLEAVFSFPNEMFYPGSNVCPCCMIFTLGKPHKNIDGLTNETFFGYYKNDGFKKKKNLGRVEQFNEIGDSEWKTIENNWITLFRNKNIIDGLSAKKIVDENDEWLCEAYMKTDYLELKENDFIKTVNHYLGYQAKIGNWKFLKKYVNDYIKIKNTNSNKITFNVLDWQEFNIGLLFNCDTTKMSVKDELKDGLVPFISRSAVDNGCVGYVEVDDDMITKGDCLTIGAEGIYSFYQPDNFATGNKIYTLRNSELSIFSYLFIATVLNKESYRYSYGRARVLSMLTNEAIKLPIKYGKDNKPKLDKSNRYSADGFIPDFDFMERYIKSLVFNDKVF